MRIPVGKPARFTGSGMLAWFTSRRRPAGHAARRRNAAAAAAAASAAVALAGCGTGGFNGIYSIPLPGGASLGSHPYTVTAEFADVLNLVPQAAVQVNHVAVGRVTSISAPPGTWDAKVTMAVNSGVHLPSDAIAEIQQSSLLGSQYVALAAPPGQQAAGSLRDHPLIPLQRTTSNATVEEVLGAMSLLFNDGGLSQLHTIDVQLNDALRGNEPQVRSFFNEVNHFISNLNAYRGQITAALDALNTLSHNIAVNDQQVGNALQNLTPGLRVMHQQTAEFVTMLNSLHKLSTIAVDVINKSEADSVADLNALAPVLRNLANAGQALPKSLQILLTYPFTDQVLHDIKGDYLNMYLSVVAAPGTCIYAPLTPGTQAVAATTFCPGQGVPGPASSPGIALPLPSSSPKGKSTPAQGRGTSPPASPASPGSPHGSPGGSASGSPSGSPSGSSSPSGSPSPTAGGSASPPAGGSPAASPQGSSSPGTQSTGGAG